MFAFSSGPSFSTSLITLTTPCQSGCRGRGGLLRAYDGDHGGRCADRPDPWQYHRASHTQHPGRPHQWIYRHTAADSVWIKAHLLNKEGEGREQGFSASLWLFGPADVSWRC